MISTTRTYTPGAPTVRHPAPDLARGGMLLLIALANVGWWVGLGAPETFSAVDRVWVLMRTGLIDQRAYPLFACLLGYGLAVMVERRTSRRPDAAQPGTPHPAGAQPHPAGVQPYPAGVQPHPAGVQPYPAPVGPDAATVDARRLLRRRGWWLIAFGAVHALVFAGDVIGAYGLVVVVIAGLVARGRLRVLGWVAGVIMVLAVATQAFGGAAVAGTAPPGESGREMVRLLGVPWPLGELVVWSSSAIAGLLLTTVVPAVVVGVVLQRRTTLLSDPAAHVRLLAGVAAAGLGLGFLGGVPYGLHVAGYATGDVPAWAMALNVTTSVLSAAGWLALFALAGARRQRPGRTDTAGPGGAVIATGRRSMTAYLGQTVIFAPLFLALGAAGLTTGIGPATAAVIAAATWAVLVGVCVLLERTGRPGPAEALIRRLVARGSG